MVSGKGRRVWSHRIRIMFVYSELNNILMTPSTVLQLPLYTPLPSSVMENSSSYSSHPPCSFISSVPISVDSLHVINSLAHCTLSLLCSPLILSIPPIFAFLSHTKLLPANTAAVCRRLLFLHSLGGDSPKPTLAQKSAAYFCQWKPDVKL